MSSSLLDRFLRDSSDFHAFGRSHQVVWLIFVLSIVFIVIAGRHLSDANKFKLIAGFCLTLQLTIVSWTVIRLLTGTFIPSVDLPFDICNFTALALMPYMLLRRNQALFDGIFLTAFSGTIQAFVTPHLYDEFPHITFLKFWIVHGGLILGGLVGAMIGGMRLSARFSTALLHFHYYMSGSILFSFVVSMLLGANYTYSRYPPPTGSALDYLGPWPIYLIIGQIVVYPIHFITHKVFWLLAAPRAEESNKKKNN